MFKNTLDNKPIFKKADGLQIRDLTKSIFDYNQQNFVTFSAYKVPKEYVMRPDLISQAVYNDTAYTELILKYNGISNPFSIDQDDVILIPSLDSAKENLVQRIDPNLGDVAHELRKTYKYIDPTKQPKKNDIKNNFDNRNLTAGNSNTDANGNSDDVLKDGALPPNISDPGTSQIDVRNGRVYFGESIGESACLKNGMTNSEFLTKVIKSRQNIEDPIL
jgi:hypothetical protein